MHRGQPPGHGTRHIMVFGQGGLPLPPAQVTGWHGKGQEFNLLGDTGTCLLSRGFRIRYYRRRVIV